MDHRQIQDRLEAFCGNELPSAEAAEVTAHLPLCAPCLEAVAEWTVLRQMLLSAPEIRPSESFIFQVMEKIEPPPAFDLSSFLRWVFPTLAVTAVALFVITAWPADDSVALESMPQAGGLLLQDNAAGVAAQDWSGLELL